MTRLNPRRHRKAPAYLPAVAMGAAVMILGGAAVGIAIGRVNALDSRAGCTITEKEDRALASLDKRSPRVYTDCGVFVVEDEPFRFHFAAADVYNTLQPGQTYDLTTVGWRLGLLSWFPNVIEAKDSPQ